MQRIASIIVTALVAAQLGLALPMLRCDFADGFLACLTAPEAADCCGTAEASPPRQPPPPLATEPQSCCAELVGPPGALAPCAPQVAVQDERCDEPFDTESLDADPLDTESLDTESLDTESCCQLGLASVTVTSDDGGARAVVPMLGLLAYAAPLASADPLTIGTALSQDPRGPPLAPRLRSAILRL